MRTKYTKDELTKCLLATTKEVTTFMERVSNAMESINDSNLLHKQAIDENTIATKLMVKSFDRFFKFFGAIILLLIGALIVLAGAKEVFKFIPII